VENYAFLEESGEIPSEQVAGRVVVLVLDDVFDNDLTCTHLIISKSIINGTSVKVFTIFQITLLNLVFVDNWEIRREELFEFIR
jgi:hypothetical protein